jgi:hypothetical protein
MLAKAQAVNQTTTRKKNPQTTRANNKKKGSRLIHISPVQDGVNTGRNAAGLCGATSPSIVSHKNNTLPGVYLQG